MSKPIVCRDIVKVVYPLYNKKTKVFSGLYTSTNYDVYKYNKVKYVRGEPMFFAEDLTNKSKVYKHISECPKTIEEGPDFTSAWKRSYSNDIVIRDSSNTVEAYVTQVWLTGKL